MLRTWRRKIGGGKSEDDEERYKRKKREGELMIQRRKQNRRKQPVCLHNNTQIWIYEYNNVRGKIMVQIIQDLVKITSAQKYICKHRHPHNYVCVCACEQKDLEFTVTDWLLFHHWKTELHTSKLDLVRVQKLQDFLAQLKSRKCIKCK